MMMIDEGGRSVDCLSIHKIVRGGGGDDDDDDGDDDDHDHDDAAAPWPALALAVAIQIQSRSSLKWSEVHFALHYFYFNHLILAQNRFLNLWLYYFNFTYFYSHPCFNRYFHSVDYSLTNKAW